MRKKNGAPEKRRRHALKRQRQNVFGYAGFAQKLREEQTRRISTPTATRLPSRQTSITTFAISTATDSPAAQRKHDSISTAPVLCDTGRRITPQWRSRLKETRSSSTRMDCPIFRSCVTTRIPIGESGVRSNAAVRSCRCNLKRESSGRRLVESSVPLQDWSLPAIPVVIARCGQQVWRILFIVPKCSQIASQRRRWCIELL